MAAALRRRELLLSEVAALLLLLLAGRAAADGAASPGCSNKLQPVKVKKNWVSGTQGTAVTGKSTTFGATLPTTVNEAQGTCAALTYPLDRCSNTASKLTVSVALPTCGQCALTAEAETAQPADDQELHKTVCSVSDPSINEPSRPVVDPSLCFLFIMAVGTIVCSSLWGEFVACQQIDGRYNQLTWQQGPNSGTNNRQDKQVIEITAKRAGFQIVICSVFLLLFYFMSSWVAWLLIVLFCIGGIEGMHVCLVTIISRIYKDLRNNTVQLPLYGEVLTLSLGVAPFCTVFAILWAAYRHSSFAWIGQDILGICWMINIIQKEHLPNIRVASVLLGGAFVYDIFWVFISPLIFHESVMLALPGCKWCSSGEVIPMLLRIPHFFDPLGGYAMLGFGDIISPGHLIAFSYRFDRAAKKGIFNGYFLWLTMGYVVGLFLACLGFFLMDGHGQPAMMYLVPCTLELCKVVCRTL
ncbi:signal peptide peptidase-like 2 isoform X3 [Triticum aestivum]|uniref:signal peptide peptidase-like 2 isoform X3 n=1 Tax=Triticum aestivum TaxID=4565 RepID=UPI001D0322D0|nr:signal peptide peptidase-like 2 isoform X3 [Triticum aestivum]XP_044422919.1 signal peptide peptidase-like 2 isoform X3 [Triticum aestivum]XP_044422920.1 signal peptide peptidase-like 2 isoform X3 [Triticum aestivum]XP_044422921.1 signal peptide peptidase-like 2 isoform X3 [Triticum aestivum]XP_044422922.1 signal peptide peptidase-like 2 isoform X3 [Triticum aestivum]